MISDQNCGHTVCVSCVGVGRRRRATCTLDPNGKGHTLVHLYECRNCDGGGWVRLQHGPPA